MNPQKPGEHRLARLEGAYEQLDKRLGDLAAVTAAGFARSDARFDRLDSRFDGLQWRMTSLIVATWVTTMLTILLKH